MKKNYDFSWRKAKNLLAGLSFALLGTFSYGQFTEGFETEIPSTWTVINQGDANGWEQNSSPTGGAAVGSGVASITYDSTAHDDYLITPAITVTAGVSDRVFFQIKSRSSAYLEPYQVLLSTTDTSAASFTEVLQAEEEAPNAWTEKEFDLSSYVGQTIYVAIKATGTNEWNLYVDDFKNDAIPTCTKPTNLVSSNITTTSVDLAWTAGGSETAWNIEYGASGFTQGSGTTVATTTNPYTLSGLTAATTYDVYVQADCGSGDTSDWIGPISITTQCEAFTTEYCENFDTATTGSFTNPTTPNCWSFLDGGTGYGYVSSTNSNSFYMYNDSDDSGDYLLVSPNTTDLSDGNHRIRFMVDGTSGYEVIVGTMSDPTDASTFTAVSTITLATSDYEEHSVEIPAGTNTYFAIKHGLGGSYRSFYIDDVCFEETPSCVNPTDVTSSNVTSNTADISWTAPSTAPANGYEYYYATDNTAPDASTTASGTSATTTVNLTGLTATTTYYVWVRSVCSASDSSSWTATAITFTTECENETPDYTQDFSTMTPDCWSEGNGTDVATGSNGENGAWTSDGFMNNGSSGAAKINLYNTGDSDWLVSPLFDIPSTGVYEVKYDFGVSTYNGTASGTLGSDDQVLFLVSVDGGAWTTLATYDSSYTTPDGGDLDITFDLSSYLGQTVQFAFWATEGTVDDDEDMDVFVDNFIVRATPVSVPDCPINVVATPDASCGNNPTTITWEAPSTGGADGYKLSIGTTAGGTDILNAEDMGTAITYSHTGTADTTYYYTVVAYNNFGDSTGCTEYSFTTFADACYNVPSSTADTTYIDSFTTTNGYANIDNTSSGYSTDGYGDFMTMSVSSKAGESFDFATTIVGGTVGTAIWIDWNNNLTFEESERVFNTTGYGNDQTGTITVPAGTADGDYRMRVLIHYNASNPTDPNASNSRLEGEDYTVTIDSTLATQEVNVRDLEGVQIYPNPFQDVVMISDIKGVEKVSIVDMAGRLVKTLTPANELNLGELKSGMYLINLSYEDGSVKTVKAIKK